MATQSPFPFLDDLFERLRSGLQPPAWMVEEIQRRLVLLLNHVLMQEPEAQARLARQAGRVVEARWRIFVDAAGGHARGPAGPGAGRARSPTSR